jgi:hypothetical protein
VMRDVGVGVVLSERCGELGRTETSMHNTRPLRLLFLYRLPNPPPSNQPNRIRILHIIEPKNELIPTDKHNPRNLNDQCNHTGENGSEADRKELDTEMLRPDGEDEDYGGEDVVDDC